VNQTFTQRAVRNDQNTYHIPSSNDK